MATTGEVSDTQLQTAVLPLVHILSGESSELGHEAAKNSALYVTYNADPKLQLPVCVDVVILINADSRCHRGPCFTNVEHESVFSRGLPLESFLTLLSVHAHTSRPTNVRMDPDTPLASFFHL